MKMQTRQLGFVVLTLAGFGCLDPLADDSLNPSRVFGNPNIALSDMPHVEDNPEFQDKLALYATEIPYLQGFAEGRSIMYWQVPEPATDLIVDLYIILEDDKPVFGPIIDVLPGDAGYSPLWRKIFLSVTETYQGERILSREAIDVAVKEGILEEPHRSELVTNCPVVSRDLKILLASNSTKTADLIPGWYRNQRVNLISFSPDLIVTEELNRVPIFPLYIFQRISETVPIAEAMSGIDEDGDNRLLSSNIIFSSNVKDNVDTRYSGMWERWLVRTSSSYPSIDSPGGDGPAYTSENDFFDRQSNRLRESALVGSESGNGYIIDVKKLDGVENCPIQKEEGKL
jgi:hypothetical protein